MELELQLETKLSQKPNLEPNDTTALTKEQQDKLNQHKVYKSGCNVFQSHVHV